MVLRLENVLWCCSPHPTGLRQSELLGLQCGDINFTAGTMSATRSIVFGVVGPRKTEASQKPVPIHPLIVDALAKCKEHQQYRKLDEWVRNRQKKQRGLPQMLFCDNGSEFTSLL
jgi:integrase